MMILTALLHDENGFIVSSELVVIATLLVVGLITGVQVIQTSVVGELNDVGTAIGSLDQSYFYAGKRGCCAWGCGRAAWTGGSSFVDCVDETGVVADFGYCYGNSYRPTYSATYTPVPFINNCQPICPTVCPPASVPCPSIPLSSACDVCPPVTSACAAPLCVSGCVSGCDSCTTCPVPSVCSPTCNLGSVACVCDSCSPCTPMTCHLIW